MSACWLSRSSASGTGVAEGAKEIFPVAHASRALYCARNICKARRRSKDSHTPSLSLAVAIPAFNDGFLDIVKSLHQVKHASHCDAVRMIARREVGYILCCYGWVECLHEASSDSRTTSETDRIMPLQRIRSGQNISLSIPCLHTSI